MLFGKSKQSGETGKTRFGHGENVGGNNHGYFPLGETVFGSRSIGHRSATQSRTVRSSFLVVLLGAISVPGHGQFNAGDSDIVFNPVPLSAVTQPGDPGIISASSNAAGPGRKLVLTARYDDDAVTHGTIDDYRTAIDAIEEESGLYAPALYQNLLGLAAQYEKLGEFELALVEYDRAGYIDRIGNGLYTREQIDIAGKSIRLLEKLNRFDEAGKRLDNYVYMHEKLYGLDSVDIVAALDKLADWQFRAYRMSMAQYAGKPAGMVSYLNGPALDNSPQGILAKTQDTRMRAIRLLVENRAFNNPLLPVLEDKLLETYFLHASLGRMIYGTNTAHGAPGNTFSAIDGGASAEIEYMNFANGVDVFKRKLHYLQQADTFAATEYAGTLVALGDWYMLFGYRVDAMETYTLAKNTMQEHAIPDQVQARLLHPAVPVSLSDVGDVGQTGEAGMDTGYPYTGWIDVKYTLNKFGHAGKIRMLAASDNTGKDISNRLLRQVRSTQFRPYLRETGSGEKEQEQVALRYYYRR